MEKGTSLPARSKPFIYYPNREVKPGANEDVLKIPVLEGESNIAKRNRYIGILEIAGKDVRRSVGEDSQIEIVLSVDQSRIVTAEAYIACLDQKFKDVMKAKISPKPEPEQLSKELKKEEERLLEVKSDLQRTGDSSLQQKLCDAKIDSKINEIKDDLKAAKGGDPDAVEKADSRIKDLQILLDPLERLAEWPSKLAKFNAMFSDCQNTIIAHGNSDDKDLLNTLKKESEKIIADKDTNRLERISQQIVQLYWEVLFRQDGFWIKVFQDIKTNPANFTDKIRAQELIKEGSMALQRQDRDSLETIVRQLWDLMPKEKQDEAGKKASESNLRKLW